MLYSPISDEELSDKNRPCEKKEYHSKSSKFMALNFQFYNFSCVFRKNFRQIKETT